MVGAFTAKEGRSQGHDVLGVASLDIRRIVW